MAVAQINENARIVGISESETVDPLLKDDGVKEFAGSGELSGNGGDDLLDGRAVATLQNSKKPRLEARWVTDENGKLISKWLYI